MNKERVLQALDNLKGSLETMDYGKWGALNVEQRNFMRALCNSWLILDDATNKQMKEIERLHSIIKEVREAVKIGISEDNYDGCVYDIKNILDKENK